MGMRAVIIASPGNWMASIGRLWTVLAKCIYPDDDVELWAPGISSGDAGKLRLPYPATVFCPDVALLENAVPWLEQLYAERTPDLLLFYGDSWGHEQSVRLAARLICGFLTDVHTLERSVTGLHALRKSCGSHLNWRVNCAGAPFIVSVLCGASNAALCESPVGIFARPVFHYPLDWLIGKKTLQETSVNPLENAERLLIGGRGLGSREACERLRRAAARWNAAPGFTRAVALNGWCGPEEIVGQSGTRTAPRVCITFGVSGAAAFLAGVMDAKTLIAVNTDKDAPIFQYAHIGISIDAPAFLEEFDQQGGFYGI